MSSSANFALTMLRLTSYTVNLGRDAISQANMVNYAEQGREMKGEMRQKSLERSDSEETIVVESSESKDGEGVLIKDKQGC